MNRRDVLKMSAGVLLASGAWPGRLRARENGQGGGEWSFIAVNDLHFKEEECGPWFGKIVAAMKQSAPQAEFCLLCGDQADQGKLQQIAGAREAFAKLAVPLFATPGNHDHLTDTDRTAYERTFPGQANHHFEHRGWQILGLDTSEGTKYQRVTIQPATFQWLDETLPKLDRAKPTLLYTHFPLGSGVTYRPTNADALLERFLDFNVQGVFSGHWHGHTEKSWRDAVLTTGRCCARVRANHDGTKEKGWFVCTAKEGKVSRRFVEIPQL